MRRIPRSDHRRLGRHRRPGRRHMMTAAVVAGATAATGTTKRYAGLTADPIRRATADRRVRREARRASIHAALALRRADQLGLVSALTDRRIARHLTRARRHASRALLFTAAPPPSRRGRNAVLIATGAGIATASVVAIRRTIQSPRLTMTTRGTPAAEATNAGGHPEEGVHATNTN